jgi:hypothetical protein
MGEFEMIAIKNKHGLWYSGDQTYGNTPVFLVSADYRNIYHSMEEANAVITRLKKKGMKSLKAVTVYKRSKK